VRIATLRVRTCSLVQDGGADLDLVILKNDGQFRFNLVKYHKLRLTVT